MLRAKYLFVPVEMCEYAISKKFIRPFQLYIYLKSSCSGKMKIQKFDMQKIASELELRSERAVKNNLKILQRKNWVGYNEKSKYFFIRGFEKIRAIQGFKSRTGAEFETKDIKSFKAFIAGAVIGYLVNQQKRREWVSERKNGRSKHLTHKPAKFYPVANLALAKILGISLSTAHGLKALANKAGYIVLKKNFTETGVNIRYRNLFKRGNPEVQHKVRCQNRKVVLQATDTVLPAIRYKRRKKIETYIMGC